MQDSCPGLRRTRREGNDVCLRMIKCGARDKSKDGSEIIHKCATYINENKPLPNAVFHGVSLLAFPLYLAKQRTIPQKPNENAEMDAFLKKRPCRQGPSIARSIILQSLR